MKTLLLTLCLFWGPSVYACYFDTDCDIGFRCVKTGYETSGVCVGHNWDDHAPNDREYPKPWKPRGSKTGQSCSFDTDCDIGKQCLKTGYAIYGVCS